MARGTAVVLVCPLGHEYVRSHRAFQKLATLLERRGYPVLRFDFSGSGDSEGDLEEARLDHWLDDLSTSLAEVRRRSGARQVVLVGMRLGASVAAIFAARRPDVDALVLWDAIVSGDEYVHELETLQRDVSRSTSASFRGPLTDPEGMEVLGFELAGPLLADLRDIDLFAVRERPAGDILLVVSAPEVDARVADHFTRAGAKVGVQHHPTPEVLGDDPFKPRIPGPILGGIATWIDRVMAS